MKKRMLQYLLWMSILCTGFILCRYIFFFAHGMKEWPVVLFVCGAVVVAVSFFAKAKYVPAVVSTAYTLSFVIGVLFQTDGVDPGGGGTNNLWIIWTAVFLITIILSVVLELFIKIKK